MNNQLTTAEQAVLEMTESLQELNDKLKVTVIQAEIIRVISRIEEILNNPIEYYISEGKDTVNIVNAIVRLNFDNRTEDAKRIEAYQTLEDVRSLHGFNDKQLTEYMYPKIEEYITWLERIRQDNYKTVDKFLNIGESI